MVELPSDALAAVVMCSEGLDAFLASDVVPYSPDGCDNRSDPGSSTSGVSSQPAVPPYSLDAIVVDYLRGLYPLLVSEHRRGAVLEKLRTAFESVKECVPESESLSSSAFVVSAILRCLHDVAWSGLWDEEEVQQFEITFHYESATRALRSDTVDWRDWASDWDACKLEVHVEALTS
ncbi:hypothetical protein VNI00_011836 [Paramarasmius palmivorus]|uniref:Uncharacterized protein n=1 Tax=Paramarasmius palmivorus TaxID=297713 RepID=A0AAW0C990_9AGAR